MMVKNLRQRSGLAWFCARAESCVVFKKGHTLFCQITPFIFIAAPKKLYSERANRGQGFQICGKNLPLRIGHVIRRMRSGCKRIVNGILWEMSELITQERISVGSSHLVQGVTTWHAMYDHWSNSKGQRSRSQGHVMYQQQQRYN